MDVAEELLDVDHTVDRAYVERRLDDWRARIDRLYADIAGWLPAGWSMAVGGEVLIHEDLMMRFGVPAQALPSKNMYQHGEMAGRIEPRGLWIIGANGRIDIILGDRHYLIIDRAESFERPNWRVSSITARRDQCRLTHDAIAQIFR